MRLEIDGTKITLEGTEPLTNDLLEQVTNLVKALVDIDVDRKQRELKIDIDAAQMMKTTSTT